MGILATVLLLLVFIALIPVIIISTLIIIRDKEREPIKTLVKYYALGILSVIIANVFYSIFNYEPNSDSIFLVVFIGVFFGIALIEELSKWISVKIGMIKDIEYDNMYDGILFAMIVSLGFAAIENILYVLGSIDSFASFYLVALFRALLAVPGHVIDGLFMGLFLEKAKISKLNDDDFGNIMYHGLSLLVPMLLHTIYDSILIYLTGNHSETTGMIMFLIFIAYIIVINVVAIVLFIKTSNKSAISLKSTNKNNVPVKRFCPNCGAVVNGDMYCHNCGYKQV